MEESWVYYVLLFQTTVAVAFATYWRYKYIRQLRERAARALMDLEWATTEQLIKELRQRPKSPYILLTPLGKREMMGIQYECHEIPPIPAYAMLKTATVISEQAIRSNGLEVPEIKMPGDGDENNE